MRSRCSYTEFHAFLVSYCREALTSQYLAFWGLCFAPSSRRRRPRTLRALRYRLADGALIASVGPIVAASDGRGAL